MVRKRTVGITAGAIAATIGLLAAPLSVRADQQILDDLIVDGSACVGQDCVNGESFGFDTIRIKENNLRIRAVDTSSTASFPTQDWELKFNDSTNGGANKFTVEAIAPSTATPFTIEAGSNSNALFVDDGGRIGLGTNTPVVQLHVKDGNTPTLRLEQDGSSGFTPQTWDVAGNEANFFVRDASNGSTLPFRIFPSAPSNSLTIEGTTGHVGVGTTSPDSDLDVEDANNPRIRITQSDADNTHWDIGHDSNGTFGLYDENTTRRLALFTDGKVRIGAEATEPAAANGDLWLKDDGVNDTLCFRTNNAWVVIAGASSCP